jgi:calcyphosin
VREHFSFFDTDNSGQITYEEFFAAMTKLNFVGVQRELEALFNKYDDDASGTISYEEFSGHLFGLGSNSIMDTKSQNIIERFKAKIMSSQYGVGGIHSARRVLAQMDDDGSKTLDLEELKVGLSRLFDMNDVSENDVHKLFNYFDRDRSGRINADELMRGLKQGMSYHRKQLVRQAFNRLDKDGSGQVTVEDILFAYDTSHHPDVMAQRMSKEDAARELLSTFECGDSVDGIVTWPEFLDYYKGISLAIDDDDYFELMMRNAWHISGGEGMAENSTCRRVLVVHDNDVQCVYEIEDDLGVQLTPHNMMLLLEKQGVGGIKEIRL